MTHLYNPVIQDEASEGLAVAAHDSLAYRIAEIETHLHSPRYWYGRNITTGFLEQSQLARFTVISGLTNVWGTPLQISDGTEIEGGDPTKYLDFGGFFVSESSMNDRDYVVDFWVGTGLFATATFMTSIPYRTSNDNTESQLIILNSHRVHCNNKIWVRCKCEADNADLLFRVGLHIYEG